MKDIWWNTNRDVIMHHHKLPIIARVTWLQYMQSTQQHERNTEEFVTINGQNLKDHLTVNSFRNGVL